MLADYYAAQEENSVYFAINQVKEKDLQVLLNASKWAFDKIVQDLILLFTMDETIDLNVNVLNERRVLEQNISYDAETITDYYGLFDWHNIPGDEFPARLKDCSQLRNGGESGKGNSKESLYRIVKMIHFFHPEAQRDPRHLLNLPEDPDFPESCRLPEYLVINVCIPNYQPGMFLLINVTEGPSTTFLAVAKITDACKRRYVDGNPNEADRLLERFLYRPEPPVGNYDVRRRLKCIVKMANYGCESVQFGRVLNQLVRSYNGTPFLLRDSTSFYEDNKSVVVTADANLFGRLAKNSLWRCRPYSVNAVMDCCCIIEADQEQNDELPENTFLSWRMKAPIFPDLLTKSGI